MYKRWANLSTKEKALSLGVVAIVIMAGWFALRPQPTETPQPQTTSTKTPAETQTNKPTTAQETVTLSKIGIKFTLPLGLKGLTYLESTDSDRHPIVFFSMPDQEVNDTCKLSTSGGILGGISKIPGQFAPSPTSGVSGVKLVKQFPSYHIGYQRPGMACVDSSKQNSRVSDLQSALYVALQTATEL